MPSTTTAETFIVTGFNPSTGAVKRATITAATPEGARNEAMNKRGFKQWWDVSADHNPIQVRQYLVTATNEGYTRDRLIWAINEEAAISYTETDLLHEVDYPNYWELIAEEIHPPMNLYGIGSHNHPQ